MMTLISPIKWPTFEKKFAEVYNIQAEGNGKISPNGTFYACQ